MLYMTRHSEGQGRHNVKQLMCVVHVDKKKVTSWGHGEAR